MKKALTLLAFCVTLNFSVKSQGWTQIGSSIGPLLSFMNYSYHGRSVAIDSNVLVVGIPGIGSGAGQAKIYEWNGTGWTQSLFVTGPSGYSYAAGSGVAVDGYRVAISIPGQGLVKVYEKVGSTWTAMPDINGPGGYYGPAVAISGNRVAVGSYLSDKVDVYEWNDTTWAQLGTSINGTGYSEAGKSVSLDGNRVAFGAPSAYLGASTVTGLAKVYEWNGSSWNQMGGNLTGEALGDEAGASVSISGDNLAVGAPFNDGGGNSAGHTRVYQWNGTTWEQLGTDIDGEAANDQSGTSVSIEGNRVAIGAPVNSGVSGGQTGQVRVYKYYGSSWYQVHGDIDGPHAGDYIGNSVDMSGYRVATGGYLSDYVATDGGIVTVFETEPDISRYSVFSDVYFATCVANPTISLSNSQQNINYYLRDDANNSIVLGPMKGNDSTINFSPSSSSTIVYNVLGATPDAYALDFDGANDYVSMSNESNFDFTGSVTLEAWVYPHNPSGLQGIISKDFASGVHPYQLRLNGNLLEFGIYTGTWYSVNSGTDTIPSNQWTHVAATYDQTNMKLFINGINVATTPLSIAMPTNDANLVIGTTNGTTYNFDGLIDEVRVWSAARTSSEISGEMATCLGGADSNLVGYFPLEAGTDSTVLDGTSNGSNGILTNMDPSSDWVTGYAVCGQESGEMLNNITISVDPAVLGRNISMNASAWACTGRPIITVDSSQVGVNYYLRNNLDNSLIEGPLAGNGSFLSFSADTIDSTKTYNIYAASSTDSAGCNTQLTPTLTATVTEITDLTVVSNVTNAICEANPVISVLSSQSGVKYFLRDDSTNNVIEGPVIGTGSDINFNENPITTNKTYNVRALLGEDESGAVDFDGVDDYMTVNVSPTLLQAQSFTIEAYVKRKSSGTHDMLLSQGFNYPNYQLNIGFGANNKFYVHFGSASLTTTQTFTDTLWHHFAVTFNAGSKERIIYYDGVPIATDVAPSVLQNNNGNMYLGRYLGGGNDADITIDELRIWLTNRTATEISESADACLEGSENGLAAYFQFEEGAGTSAHDSTSSGYIAQMFGGAEWSTSDFVCIDNSCELELSTKPTITISPMQNQTVQSDLSSQECSATPTISLVSSQVGVNYFLRNNANDSILQGPLVGTGAALSFATDSIDTTTTYNVLGTSVSAGLIMDGVNDNISVNGINIQNSSFTIEAWVKRNSSGTNDMIAGQGIQAPNQGLHVGFRSTNEFTFAFYADDINSNQQYTDTSWHHWAVTYDTSTNAKVIYRDGQVVGSGTASNDFNNTGTFYLASAAWGGNNLDGNMDEYRIWSTPRTQSEIQENMHSCLTGSETGLMAYYKLNDGTGSATADDETSNGYNGTLNNMDVTNDWVDGVSVCSCSEEMTITPTVTVVPDSTAPIADSSSLPDLVNECSVSAPTAPTATDSCSGAITATTTTSFPVNTQGTTTITWTFDDGNGNTSTQTQDVIIADTTAPVADSSSLPDLLGECLVSAPTPPTSTDSCEGAITGTTTTSFPITSQGTTTITWTFNDSLGNISTQTQDVVIADTTAPVADSASLPDLMDECSVSAPTAPTATDNCEGAITGTTTTSFPVTAQGTTTITWTFNDGHGNISTQTQDLVISDTTAPVADSASLPDLLDECSVSAPNAPTAVDNCEGAITGTTTTSFPVTAQGTTTITWTFDDGNGNTSTQTQDVIIVDTTAPIADSTSLPDLLGECLVSAPTPPTSTDNCEGAISGTTTTSFPITSQGTTTITWTFGDSLGNTSTQTQDVVIADTTAPVADSASLPNLLGECSVSAPTAPTSTDNCEGTITGTTTTSFPITSQGTTTITWTFGDSLGNTSTQTQDVVIADTTAPVADSVSLPDLLGECSVSAPTAPTATDNCEGATTGTTTTSFPVTTQGTTTITWTFDDGNGNTSTQLQYVVITDTTIPVADSASLPDLLSDCSVSAPTPPTANDNCEGAVTGTTTTSFPVTTQGTTIITWTFDDGNGNTSTQLQYVVISDTVDPIADLTSLPDLLNECSVSTPTAPTATDNCEGAITGTTTTSFPITSQGTTTITWIFDDGNGNTSTLTQNVIIPVTDLFVSITDSTLTSADTIGAYQWLDCDNDFEIINGETEASYKPTSTGTYAVQIVRGSCADTSDCYFIEIDANGISKTQASDNIIVYPIPTRDLVFIQSQVAILNWSLTSTEGKLIMSGEQTISSIDLSMYPPSIYFLKLTTMNGVTIKKVVID